MLRKFIRKGIQGVVTALGAVAVAGLAVTGLAALDGGDGFTFDAALRVGLPSFLVGVIFFPVNEKTLGSRAGFALRAAAAAVASGLAHRALWWGNAQTLARQEGPLGWVDTLWAELSEAATALLHPWVLLPDSPLEATLALAVGATAGAALAAFLAQPSLLRLARGLRTARPRLSSQPLDATGARDSRGSISA